MSTATSIEWTNATWNPIRGCSRVSEGCRHCYAEVIAERFSDPGQAFYGFAQRGKGWTGVLTWVTGLLDLPLRWRSPRRVFVNSMSDLFHERLDDDVIEAVFGVMALAPQHTFQVLTKRADRMRKWFALERHRGALADCLASAYIANPELARRWPLDVERATAAAQRGWPLPNVWLGVSVENQEAADERIPLLLETPAAVRFLSVEPLLGAVDLRGGRVLALDDCSRCGDWRQNHLPTCQEPSCTCPAYVPQLDWVIVGGESGSGARPCDVRWVRSIVAQCAAANVPCFVKQLGARPIMEPSDEDKLGEYVRLREDSDDYEVRFADQKGGDPSEWPDDLRVREWPGIRP